MSNKSDESQLTSGSRDAKVLRSWWEGAKDFVVNKCGMYDMGDNAQNISFTATTVNVVIGDRPAPGGAPCVDVGKAQGLAILLYRTSLVLMIR